MTQSSAGSSVGRLLESYLGDLESGHPPDREALLSRNPDVADLLVAALDGLDFVHGAACTLKGAPGDTGVGTGETIGDFRLLGEIGRGGMAMVYEAEQLSLGRRVALKILPFASVLDPKQRQRFKNEALAAAQLRHPHIVPVYAVGSERGVHYYAMQYVEGASLAAAIQSMREGSEPEKRTPPFASLRSHRDARYARMIAALGIQAAEALEHAHRLGIVHRDVKPANLLVDREGTLWVTDFGLARSMKDGGLTTSGELLGTVRYMSPEQALAGRASVDHRTDVYSLGATLYEMLVLEPAFRGEDLPGVLDAIKSQEPPPPRRLNSAIPVDLETIVLKAMAKDPAARYASAQELADDLQRWLDDEPVLARRPSLLARIGKWARRHHRKGVAAAVTVVFVGAVALAAGAVKEERETRQALAKAEANLALAHQAVDELLARLDPPRSDQPAGFPTR